MEQSVVEAVYTPAFEKEIKYYDQLHQEKYRDKNQTHRQNWDSSKIVK